MTIADLLDQIRDATGDKSSNQRSAARRWLNLTRSYIADERFWKCSLDPSASFTATSGSSTGVFSIGSDYEHVYGDLMYNETDDMLIRSSSLMVAKGSDIEREVSGPPTLWSDAGMNTSGVRQVYLWPIPSATTTVGFIGMKKLTSLTNSNDNDSIDPYFGEIQTWAACFAEGMRYFSMDADNEDVFATQLKFKMFERAIKARGKHDGVAPHATLRLASVKQGGGPDLGRLDPAHFDNG